jgi:hypothetical protein
MDAMQRLATVATVAVRHACAYGDLIADDAAIAYDAIGRRLWVGIVMIAAALFAIAMACLWAIAVTWDTAARLWLISAMFGGFGLIAIWAFVTLRRLWANAPRFLEKSGSEWRKDRALIDELLSRVSAEHT